MAPSSHELVAQLSEVPLFLTIHELLQRPGGVRHQQFRVALTRALSRKWRYLTLTADTGPTGFAP